MSADPSPHSPDVDAVVDADFDLSFAGEIRDVEFDVAEDVPAILPDAATAAMTPVADLASRALPAPLAEALRQHQPPTAMEARADVLATVAAAAPGSMTAIEQRATSFLDTLKAHQIVDDASFLKCDELFTSAKRMLDEIASTFDPIIAAANKTHKDAIAAKKRHAEPIERALADLQRLFLTEKGRRDQEAERQRALAEAQVRQEVETAADEIAGELESIGDFEAAETVREQAKATAVGAIMPASTVVNKLANVSTSGRWKVDESKLALLETVKAVAAGKAPIESLAHNLTYLNKRAAADKAALKIPGVPVHFVPNVRVRR